MGFLASIGTWLLKLLLGGLFGSINQQLEDEAQASAEAGIEHAHSTQEAAATEVAIIQAQQAAEDKINAAKPTATDPFASEEWNKGT